jgi:FkbM family methyltransferase
LTFVDVGANTGLVSLAVLAQHPSLRVCMIEPHPVLMARAIRNVIELNPHLAEAGAVLCCEQAAVGDRNDNLILDLSNGYGTASIQSSSPSESVNVQAQPLPDINVQVRTLADILQGHGIERAHAMKIDIEGWEDAAIPPYLACTPKELWPTSVVLERPPSLSSSLTLSAFLDGGLVVAGGTHANLFLSKPK